MNIFRRTEKNNLSRVLSYINVVGVLLLGLFLLLLLPETAGSKETGGKEVAEQPPVARKDSEEVNRMESIVEELAEQGVIVEADPERGQLRFREKYCLIRSPPGSPMKEKNIWSKRFPCI